MSGNVGPVRILKGAVRRPGKMQQAAAGIGKLLANRGKMLCQMPMPVCCVLAVGHSRQGIKVRLDAREKFLRSGRPDCRFSLAPVVRAAPFVCRSTRTGIVAAALPACAVEARIAKRGQAPVSDAVDVTPELHEMFRADPLSVNQPQVALEVIEPREMHPHFGGLIGRTRDGKVDLLQLAVQLVELGLSARCQPLRHPSPQRQQQGGKRKQQRLESLDLGGEPIGQEASEEGLPLLQDARGIGIRRQVGKLQVRELAVGSQQQRAVIDVGQFLEDQ